MSGHDVAVRAAQHIQWHSGKPMIKTLLIVSGGTNNIPWYGAVVFFVDVHVYENNWKV
jgi:hypothetical protein